jgi:uncharacterized membrane protein
MSFLNFCNWIENSPLGAGIKNSIWIFPVVESIHILGIVLLVFTVALVDLRVPGWASPGGDLMRRRPLREIAGNLLPWMWRAVAIVIVTGILLFSSEAASKCYESKAFYIKMILILVAVVNAAASHYTVRRHAPEWDRRALTPLHAKLMAILSLTAWAGVVFAGRGIAYF